MLTLWIRNLRRPVQLRRYKVKECRPVDDKFLTNYALKVTGLYKGTQTDPVIQAVSEFIFLKTGHTLYDTTEDLTNLLSARQCQRGLANDKLKILPGPNDYVFETLAPTRFNCGPVTVNGELVERHCQMLINGGDGTRGRREWCTFSCKDLVYLVGLVWPADVSKWPSEPGLIMPVYMDDLLTMLEAVHSYNMLSHEFDTELFRSLSDSSVPMLIHTIFPEPHSGNTSFLHAKMWIHFVNKASQNQLSICYFVSDCCSTGQGAMKLLARPRTDMILLDVVYVGADADDFQYFAVQLRAAVKLPRGTVYYPPATVLSNDPSHHVRTARKTYHNIKKCVVWLTVKGTDGEEALVHCTFNYLIRLAADRRFRDKYGLADMCRFEDIIDQKGDAAWRLHSWEIIQLLERHAPQDRGTILALKATHYLTSPYKTANFTDPFRAVYMAWRGLAMWEAQEHYVGTFVKRLDLHCPSSQFREGNRLLAHSAYTLAQIVHLEKCQLGSNFENFEEYNLKKCNTDVNEQVHSEERSGGILPFNNDSSVNMAEHLWASSKIQQVHDRIPILEDAELKVSGTRNNQLRSHCVDMGLPPFLQQHQITYGLHSSPQIERSPKEFRAQLEEFRAQGYADGLREVYETIPEMKTQFEEFAPEKMLKSIADRVKIKGFKKQPLNRDDWLFDSEADLVHQPSSDIRPDQFPDPGETDDCVEEAEPAASGPGEISAREVEIHDPLEDESATQNEYPAVVNELAKKAKVDRASFQALAETHTNTFIGKADSADVTNWARLLRGDVVLDSFGNIHKVSRLLRAYQLRDYHGRGRGERFWVGRLRSFSKAIIPGSMHNVTLGTVMLMRWGGRNDRFAVVRVMGIVEAGKKEWSCKLKTSGAKDAKQQIFMVELLDPIGPVDHQCSQKYGSSGFCLPKVTANLILQTVNLLDVSAFTERGVSSHEAVLEISALKDAYSKGMQRITAQEDHLHVENKLEQIQNMKEGSSVLWNPKESEHSCFICNSSFFDDSSGLMVQCQRCRNAWHQDCHPIKIKLEDAVSGVWECGVCSGAVVDVCCHCHLDFEVVGKKKEADNNRVVYCDGDCGRLFHQKCHSPPIIYDSEHAAWRCTPCQMAFSQHEADQSQQHVSSRPSRSCKTTLVGALNGTVSRVHGIPVPGMVISDGKGTSLENGTWDQNYVHGGSRRKQKAKPKAAAQQSDESCAPPEAAAPEDEYHTELTNEQWCAICRSYKDPALLNYVGGSYHCTESCLTGRSRRR